MDTSINATQPVVQHTDDFARQTYSVVKKRLLTFLFICYTFAFLDRVNIGFAKLQMQNDLGFTEAIYGLGAGLFFVTYFLTEVPSNMALKRFGARRWIARIMVTWGILSALTAFVSTPTQFYVIRLLLGMAEAGFFPGVMLYLTYWFPARERGRAISLFIIAIPFSSLVGAPFSGWILQAFADSQHLHAWQWLFLIEGIPSLILGIVCWFFLNDTVDEAKWLSPEQKMLIRQNLDKDHVHAGAHSFMAAAKMPQVWLMSLTNFALLAGIVVILWLPSFYKNAGVLSPVHVGWFSAIPFGISIISILLVARHSDKTGERRWHTAIPAFVAGGGLMLMSFSLDDPYMLLGSAVVMVCGFMTLNALFWNLPTTFLAGNAAVVGIAFINSVGQVAGFAAPSAFGWAFGATGSPVAGLIALGILFWVGALAAVLISKRDVNR